MKVRTSLRAAVGLAFLLGPTAGSFAQNTANPTAALPPGEPITLPSGSIITNAHTTRTDAVKPADKKDFNILDSGYVSPWLIDLLKLSKAHIDDSVMVDFIDLAGTFNLDAEKIIFLRDAGLSPEVISVMLQHDNEIFSGLRQVPPTPSSSQSPIKWSLPQSGSGNARPVVAAPEPKIAQPREKVAPIAHASDATGSIISPDPNTLLFEQDPEPMESPSTHLSAPPIFSPVRQPYPVQLVDPIIVVRGYGRPANMTVLRLGF